MSLSSELKRRNVYKVGAAYLVVAWLLLEVASVVAPILDLPAWVPRAILLVLGIGFPLSLFFAWAFELTPDGIKPTSEIQPEDSITGITGRKLDFVVIGLLSLAVLVLVVDKYVLVDSPEANMTTVEPSIAVLPFVDMSPDNDHEYLSDGISQELLNLLTQVEGLKVIARTSWFAFKGKSIGVNEIAEKLNVAHVLEGSVRKSGNRLRITVNLILADDGSPQWSETWERELKDIFAIQDEIAAAVVEQMHIKLLGEPPRLPTAATGAYTLYLKGLEQYNRYTPEGWAQAETLFLESTRLDDRYAPAWRGLAVTYGWLALWDERPLGQAYASAKSAIERAQLLAPEDSLNYVVLAWFVISFEHDVTAAARYVSKAQELMSAGNEPERTIWATASLAELLGQRDKALQLTELEILLDPFNPNIHLTKAWRLSHVGCFDDASASFRHVDDMAPGFIDAPYWVARNLFEQGKVDAALAELSQNSGQPLSEVEFHAGRLSLLTQIYYELGRNAESDAALSELMSKDNRYPKLIAHALDTRGELDRAFAHLEKAREYRDPDLLFFLASPRPLNMHDDPRWIPFLRSVGMAPEQLAKIELNTDPSTFTQ